jgi:hypothetical protein
VTQLVPLVEKIPPIGGKPGAPLQKPEQVMGDRGYDSDKHRMELSCKNIPTQIARKRTPHGSGLKNLPLRGGADDRVDAPIPAFEGPLRQA